MRPNGVTEYEKQFILDNYNTMMVEEIAQQLNCNKKRIGYIAKTVLKLDRKPNIREIKYKYEFNKYYFNNIDTPQKAYILGFILADGCICVENDRFRLMLTVKSDDISILEFIKTEIEGNQPITHRVIKEKYHANSLIIYSKDIVKKLQFHGIDVRKTYTDTVPQNIPNEFNGDLLCGLFDGDGCIYTKHRTRGKYRSLDNRWQITAKTKQFLENIRCLCNINIGRIAHCRSWHTWEVSNRKDIKLLYDFMYKNSYQWCLKRKFNKFEEIFNYENPGPLR